MTNAHCNFMSDLNRAQRHFWLMVLLWGIGYLAAMGTTATLVGHLPSWAIVAFYLSPLLLYRYWRTVYKLSCPQCGKSAGASPFVPYKKLTCRSCGARIQCLNSVEEMDKQIKTRELHAYSLPTMPLVLKYIFGLSAIAEIVFVLFSLTPFFELYAGILRLDSSYWWRHGPGWISAFSAFTSLLALVFAIRKIKLAKMLLVFSWLVSGLILPLIFYSFSNDLLLLAGSTSIDSIAIIALAIYLYRADVVRAYFG